MSASKYILILLLLFPSVAYGAVITIDTNMSADATIAGFNNNFQILSDWANGDVEGSAVNSATTNILADSIGELDMGDEANPRVRDSELFGITTDSYSDPTLTQNSYVVSGLLFADDGSGFDSTATLGVAYINGYRVSKAAVTLNTASTPALVASKDNYVDLEQDGDWHVSDVALGGTAPAVFANSARIAKIITGAADVTSVTDLARRTLSTILIPVNYRDNLIVSFDTASTAIIDMGNIEINSTMVAKSAPTTLTLATAGHWADGTASTSEGYYYVGIDTSGNIKFLETAATAEDWYSNYAVSNSTGVLRYVTENSTVYRVLGWFYINSAGTIVSAEISNIREGGAPNTVVSADATDRNFASPVGGGTIVDMNFYSTGRPITIDALINWNVSDQHREAAIFVDGTEGVGSRAYYPSTGAVQGSAGTTKWGGSLSQGTHDFVVKVAGQSGDTKVSSTVVTITEF